MTSKSLFDLSGRLALITGSGQGIGLALARGLGDILRLAISAQNTGQGEVSFQVRASDAPGRAS